MAKGLLEIKVDKKTKKSQVSLSKISVTTHISVALVTQDAFTYETFDTAQIASKTKVLRM